MKNARLVRPKKKVVSSRMVTRPSALQRNINTGGSTMTIETTML